MLGTKDSTEHETFLTKLEHGTAAKAPPFVRPLIAGLAQAALADAAPQSPESAIPSPTKRAGCRIRVGSLWVVFGRLEFVYLPSRDVAADVQHFTTGLGAELVFAIEAFGTRVAMIRLNLDPPAILLAEHLQGDQPVLLFCVPDLDRAVVELESRGVEVGARFDIPHGPVVEMVNPGPQRVALYQLTRPDTAERLNGRRDF